MKRFFMIFLFTSPSAFAQNWSFGGFVDAYYGHSFNQHKKFERSFTTQPVRMNEPNINLAFGEVKYNTEKFRGKLAIQGGNSVSRNYLGESPPDIKALQEAYVGFKLSDKTWIDMGIYLGHIGMESWISRDNYTYTRSLQLDYVPYYASGVRLEHQIDSTQKIQFHILNGWQNITKQNSAKDFGLQYWKRVNSKLQFTYNNFLGDEEYVSSKPRFRSYHDFIFHFDLSSRWNLLTSFDIGHQSTQEKNGIVLWFATSTVARFKINEREAVALRVEYYNDRHQANVVTNTHHGFQVFSSSVNYDREIYHRLKWRTELRGFQSRDKIYPKSSGLSFTDLFLVTSLSVSL